MKREMIVVVALMMFVGAGYCGEPGAGIDAQIRQAFESPVEPPQSVSVQTPGERIVYVEVPAEPEPGIGDWVTAGVQGLLGFVGDWLIDKPVNVTVEGLVATKNTGNAILDGAGNMTAKAIE